MIEIEVQITDPRWDDAGFEGIAQRACNAVAGLLDLADGFVISVLACDDARITELNADFRDKPAPTNVLSWPDRALPRDQPGSVPERPDPSDPELGDIAIAYDTCAKEAHLQSKVFADHVAHLMIHGMLHLLGYDHLNDQDAALMEGLETEILAKLDIPDPY